MENTANISNNTIAELEEKVNIFTKASIAYASITELDGTDLHLPKNIAYYIDCRVCDATCEYMTFREYLLQGKDINALIKLNLEVFKTASNVFLPIKDGIIRVNGMGEAFCFDYNGILNLTAYDIGAELKEAKAKLEDAKAELEYKDFMPSKEESDTINKMCDAMFAYMREHNIIFQMNADCVNIFKCDDWTWDNNGDYYDTELTQYGENARIAKNYKKAVMGAAVTDSDREGLTEIKNYRDFLLQCETACVLFKK